MRRRASEQGAVAPASLLAAAVVAVAIGTAGYAMTSGPSSSVQQQPDASVQPKHVKVVKPTPTPSASPTPTAPMINRSNYNVAIYNDTTVTGLAARTTTKAETFGWKVVTTSQWYGTIDVSAVYYPPGMKAAAQQLATDLGIATIKPAIAPMQMDQLTAILSTDYTG